MADQVLYAVTNFVLTTAVAHFSDARTFGSYAVLYATFLILAGIARGLICEPLIIGYSAASHDRWDVAAARALRNALGLGVLFGLVLAVAVSVAPAEFRPLGYVFAGGLPVLLAQDLLRYAALALGRPTAAVVNDATVFVVQIAATSAVVLAHVQTPSVLVLVWILAGAVGGVVAARVLRLVPTRRADAPRADRSERGLALRLGVDNAVIQSAQQGTGYILAAVAGLAAAGGLRGAQTAYAPAATLSLGVQSAVVPELVRLRDVSVVRMARAMRGLGVALALVAAVFTVGVPAIPDSVGRSVLGPAWLEARPVLILIGLAQFAAVPAGVAQAGLRALGDGRRTLRARLLGVAWYMTAAFVPALLFGLSGAGAGMVVGSAGQSVVWFVLFRLAYRERLASDAVASDSDTPRTVSAPTPAATLAWHDRPMGTRYPRRRSTVGRPLRRIRRWARHTSSREVALTMICVGFVLIVGAALLALVAL